MILQEQKRAFLCVEGGVDEGLAMLAAPLACCEAFLVPQSMSVRPQVGLRVPIAIQ